MSRPTEFPNRRLFGTDAAVDRAIAELAIDTGGNISAAIRNAILAQAALRSSPRSSLPRGAPKLMPVTNGVPVSFTGVVK